MKTCTHQIDFFSKCKKTLFKTDPPVYQKIRKERPTEKKLYFIYIFSSYFEKKKSRKKTDKNSVLKMRKIRKETAFFHCYFSNIIFFSFFSEKNVDIYIAL